MWSRLTYWRWSRNYNQYFLGGTKITIIRIPSPAAVTDVVLRWECFKIFNIYIVGPDWADYTSLDDNLMYNSVFVWIHLEMELNLKIGNIARSNWSHLYKLGQDSPSLPPSSILSLRSSLTSRPSDNGELKVCYNPINNSQPLIGKPIRRETFFSRFAGLLGWAGLCVSGVSIM